MGPTERAGQRPDNRVVRSGGWPDDIHMTNATKTQDVLRDTERKHARTAESIIRNARELQSKLDSVIESVETGLHLNSCGEIQGRAASFDILCAQYEDLSEHIAALKWAVEA